MSDAPANSRRRTTAANAGARVGLAVAAAALVGSLAAAQPARDAGAGSGDPLRVCLLDRDLPRAERAAVGGAASGFDLELAQALAERVGRSLEVVWHRSGSPFSEIEESELPLDALVGSGCDVVPSVPGRAALGELAGRIELTSPYYGAAFELVATGEEAGPRSFDQLDGEVIAVRLQTLAHFAVQRRGLRWLAAPTTEEVLALLDSGRATAALVWGPTLAGSGVAPDASWEPPSFLRFNLHLAVRGEDTHLLAELERALESLVSEGAVARLAERWGLSRAPFDGVYDPATWSAAASR